ncbi:MAG: UvrD-helicase domain-containing protein [Gemmatimonadota bacterium]
MKWTSEQIRAITAQKHTLLAASAGTGKTTTVVGKILWHLGLTTGVRGDTGAPLDPCPPHRRIELNQLAAITFTEKAAYDLARKLRESIAELAPDRLWDLDAASIGTIHSFAGGLLREHALRLGVDPSFRVLDEREARLEHSAIARELLLERVAAGDEDVAELMVRYPLDPLGSFGKAGAVNFVLQTMRDLRWHAKRYDGWTGEAGNLDWSSLHAAAGGSDPNDEVTARFCDTLVRLGKAMLGRWLEFLRVENARDFDALVLDCRDQLFTEPGRHALETIRTRYRLLIIDEFQDTDGAQRDIAFRIAGLPDADGAGPTLFLVGDPKQSIYGFRGADIAVWNEVSSALGGTISLSRNYRSVPSVVAYVNNACESVMTEMGAAVLQDCPKTHVEWAPLEPWRTDSPSAGTEWLVADGKADDRRSGEAELVAQRIRDIVGDDVLGDSAGGTIVDPDTMVSRVCKYRDVAILFRSGFGVTPYAAALSRWGVPFYLAGNLGLKDQLEVEDLLNLFTLVANPFDDLAAFSYLRSPFVALRDEVLVAIRFAAAGRPMLDAARKFLQEGNWFIPPEHDQVVALEREGLRQGLELIDDLVALRSRAPLDQLAVMALERSGYPLHLLLLNQPLPRVANLQRFVRVLEGYRGQTVGSFLEIWGQWKDEDIGLPQAPLYSKRDNVVTLSTVHAAKGLEWPVVFLVDLAAMMDKSANTFWSDSDLGPVLAPKKEERGARVIKLCARRDAEEKAEEGRVFYVAATRARDRLILAGASEPTKGRAEWAARGRTPAMTMTTEIVGVDPVPLPAEPSLSWIDAVEQEAGVPPLAASLHAGSLQCTRSASELMARARNGKDHRLQFLHGVMARWRFAPTGSAGSGAVHVPSHLKGVLVHGVLERIREEMELADLLEMAVGALDAPELEEYLSAGTAYRDALEEEIRKVVKGDQWKWYVEAAHWRELKFVQFGSPLRWRVGAMDLYRPGSPGRIVDFKTQDVEASGVDAEARKYRFQAATYRTVAKALGGEASVDFHFTVPNMSVRG